MLERVMNRLRATDEPDAGQAITPFIKRPSSRFDNAGMIGESEIVVGAKVQHFGARRNTNPRVLGRRDLSLGLVQAVVANLVERGLCDFSKPAGASRKRWIVHGKRPSEFGWTYSESTSVYQCRVASSITLDSRAIKHSPHQPEPTERGAND